MLLVFKSRSRTIAIVQPVFAFVVTAIFTCGTLIVLSACRAEKNTEAAKLAALHSEGASVFAEWLNETSWVLMPAPGEFQSAFRMIRADCWADPRLFPNDYEIVPIHAIAPDTYMAAGPLEDLWAISTETEVVSAIIVPDGASFDEWPNVLRVQSILTDLGFVRDADVRMVWVRSAPAS